MHVALHTFHIFFIFFIKEDLKTEPGDEEYFVKLKLIPKQLPSKDSIITNKTELDI